MPRKPIWPPPIKSRRGKDYVRIPIAGGRRWVTLGPSGSPESRREYARILAEVEAGGGARPEPAAMTVLDVIVAYHRHAEAHQGYRQLHRIRKALQPAKTLYGHTRAADFGPLALKAVRQQYVEHGYCRRYCNQLTDCVRVAFKWAASEELVPHGVSLALMTVAGLRMGHTTAPEHAKIQPADLGDVERTLPHLPAIPGAMVRLQLLTGMRPGEACLLRPADLDRDWLTVDGVTIWLYKLDEHKNDWRGQLRWIPLGPRAQALLLPYLSRAADAYCFAPRETAMAYLSERGRMVRLAGSRTPGMRYSTQAYDRVVLSACRRAGTSWAPNQLRHAVATDLETRFGREDARCVLGHSNPSTTAIYARSVERAAAVLAQVG